MVSSLRRRDNFRPALNGAGRSGLRWNKCRRCECPVRLWHGMTRMAISERLATRRLRMVFTGSGQSWGGNDTSGREGDAGFRFGAEQIKIPLMKC